MIYIFPWIYLQLYGYWLEYKRHKSEGLDLNDFHLNWMVLIQENWKDQIVGAYLDTYNN